MIPSRLLVVPRWAGRPGSDFYPWLVTTLAAEHPGRFAQVQVLDLPHPELPEVEVWTAAISWALGTAREQLAHTYVLAHSVGCQALLRSLTRLPVGASVAGVLAVAGWFAIDRPWDSIRPWLEPIPELARARAATKKLQVLLSDNDPFTSDYAANQRAWQEQLSAQVQLVPSGLHFNAKAEPAVLSALLTLSDPAGGE
jgi:predicted alpha/beta hydrolase family esterase